LTRGLAELVTDHLQSAEHAAAAAAAALEQATAAAHAAAILAAEATAHTEAALRDRIATDRTASAALAELETARAAYRVSATSMQQEARELGASPGDLVRGSQEP
jgi:hypothetical protein